MNAIVKFYVRRIRTGKMTLEEVPEMWREQVEEALTAEEYEKITGEQ